MPKVTTVHWNPPESKGLMGKVRKLFGRTRCGLSLRKVPYRDDPKDATCNNCVRLAEKDGVR